MISGECLGLYQHATHALYTAPTKGGHAGDVLPDGGDGGEEVVQHGIHEHQVNDCLNVSGHAKILVVVACNRYKDEGFRRKAPKCRNEPTSEGHLEAMVVVHHGGDAVKAVAVKFKFVDPPARIGH